MFLLVARVGTDGPRRMRCRGRNPDRGVAGGADLPGDWPAVARSLSYRCQVAPDFLTD